MANMFKEDQMKKVAGGKANWEKDLQAQLAKTPERRPRFSTLSDLPIKSLYAPDDIQDMDYEKDLGFPSQYPFTRGVQPSMYRGQLWTMRMFAGSGSAEETNARFHHLVNNGQTGLSVAFDYPTLMGYDTDSPRAQGECGKCGVAIDTLADMEILFDRLPIDRLTTSMTINPPASVIWAMYIALAEKRDIPRRNLGGTIQNDILKEFAAQKTFMCPLLPSLRLVTDTIEFGTREVPRWNPVSISGYHIREAGATAVQELAFTLADGLAYVQAAVERGLKVDDFAPRLSFFFDAHIDFFEEVAKFRAARRMWARFMKERFKAQNPRSWWMRFHTQTAGVSLTAQQPYNNVIRVALEALAAVLGGTQSLHTCSLDEVHSLPTEEAVTIALRTQQIIAEESGVTHTIDPLGGSYFIESLTNEIEEQAMAYIRKIDDLGGMTEALERHFPQREIANAAYAFQKQVEQREKIMVGVNKYFTEQPRSISLLPFDPELEKKQIARLQEVKSRRNSGKVRAALEQLEWAAAENRNVMPFLIEAVKEYATLQECCDVFRKVFGIYRDPGIF
jgi:methylmalonyl-CoA mutase N-terminal domain/subunit